MSLPQKLSMSFSFPYQYGIVDNRQIPYPIVTIQLETIRGKRNYSFIMDTGADTLTLPQYMIKLLGLDRSKLSESKSQGIGKELIKTWEGKIPISFCGKSFTVYCSFTDNDVTPFLLGKEDIFDKFNILFDNEKGRVVFENR